MRSYVLGAFSLVLLAGCAAGDEDAESSEDMLVSSAARPFDVAQVAATKTFRAPSGRTEVCVIPKHLSEDGFTKKDAKKEAKLCKVDLDAAPGADVLAGGLAPKANSTNPATDVHEVTAEVPREVVESFAEANARDRKAKKIGRIKSSLDARYDRTASYAPSLVGYYATSRLLGNIAEVTPAVWRTIDVARHAKVAENGKKLTVPGSQIVKNLWATFLTADNGGQKGDLTYTKDGGQVYGAFIPSVSGDAKDKAIDTLAGLTASPRAKRLVDPRPVSADVGTDLKSAVTTLVPMEGVVEMLVLDSIMLQADRLSGDNVSYVPYVYYPGANGSVERMSKDDFDDMDAAARPAGTVAVNKLYLNDVDAGLMSKNADSMQAGTQFGLLKKVAHIDPDLYGRVQALAKRAKDPSFQAFASTEWRYTDRDWVRYSTMIGAVATLLKDRCTSGALLQDLNLQKHMTKSSPAARTACE